MTEDTISRLLALIDDYYVFPDVAKEITGVVRTRCEQGRYDGLDDEALSAAVTADLQSVNGDKHLRLMYHADQLPDQVDDTAVQEEYFRNWADETCGGVVRAERLRGNVGCLELGPIIFPGPLAGESITAAMTLMSTTNALILDLRGCLGGEPGMAAFVCSYFFGSEQVELSGMYQRKGDRFQQMWTSAYVPGRKFGPDKPVYVLTSSRTFSGGEALAYDLKHSGRAQVIGEVTRGGAHPRDGFKLGAHLEATIPTARSINPVTQSNWEGIGVEPDLKVAAEEALTSAYDLALAHVLATVKSRAVLEEARGEHARIQAP